MLRGHRHGHPLPRPRGARRGRCARAVPTRPGSAGASSPRTRRSPSCAPTSASRSSARPPEAMRLLGDKIEAKLLAEQAGVPVAPWSGGPVETRRGRPPARRHDRLPADHQGPQRRRRPRHPHRPRPRTSSSEALERTAGRGRAHLRRPRHLHGAAGRGRPARRGAGHRRPARHRVGAGRARLLDPAAQPEGHRGVQLAGAQPPSRTASLRESAIALVKAAGYVGAGTVEFLYQPDEKLFAFLEVNTRLQVEHPVTEVTTGLDLVKLQLHVAERRPARGRLPAPSRPRHRGPAQRRGRRAGLRPRPRHASSSCALPTGPGVRVDTGIAEGDVIPPEYDSMIAKVIAWGRDRPEALARLRCALRETTVVLRGGTTTKSFLLDLLDRAGGRRRHRRHRAGSTAPAPAAAPTRRGDAEVALVQVAIDVSDAEEALERAAFLASARGGRPRAAHEVGRTVELGYRGQVYRLTVAQVGPRPVPGRARRPARRRRGRPARRRWRAGSPSATGAARSWPSTAPTSTWSRSTASPTGSPGTRPASCAPRRRPSSSPSAVAAGDEVEAGQTVVVLESMKMETAVRAPFAGTVREVLAVVNARSTPAPRCCASTRPATRREEVVRRAGRRCPAGDAAAPATPATGALDAARRAAGADHRLRRERRARAGSCVAEYGAAARRAAGADDELLHGELALLTTFADLGELSRNRPTSAEEDGRRAGPQPARVLPRLPALARRRAGGAAGELPRPAAPGAAALRRRPTLRAEPPELEEAVYRIFLAQQRIGRPGAGRPGAARPLAERGQLPAGPLRAEVGRGARPAGRRHPAALPRRSATSPAPCGSGTSRSRSSSRPARQVVDAGRAAARRAGRRRRAARRRRGEARRGAGRRARSR